MKNAKEIAERLLAMQKVLFEFAEIERQIYFPDGKKQDRRENDAEHSYSLAMAAWHLAHFYPHLDRDKLIRYALVHDFVEIHAGDIQAINRTEAEAAAKVQREAAALKRIENEWPDFQDLTRTIHEYEARADAESKFIYALDKLMPMLLNLLSNGKTWKKYGFEKQSVLEQKDEKVAISPEVHELWHIYRQQIVENEGYFNAQ